MSDLRANSFASPRLASELSKLHELHAETDDPKIASPRRAYFLMMKGEESLPHSPSFSAHSKDSLQLPPIAGPRAGGRARRASATYPYPAPTTAAESVASALALQLTVGTSDHQREMLSRDSSSSRLSPRVLAPPSHSNAQTSGSALPALSKAKSRRSSLSMVYKQLGIPENDEESKILKEIRALDRDYGLRSDGSPLAIKSLNEHLKQLSTPSSSSFRQT